VPLQKLRPLDVHYMVNNDPPPIAWIAEGLVAREAVTMIHGAAGLGKSMLALALAAAVLRGEAFLHHPTTRGRVLYIDAENGQGEAHRRIRGIGITSKEAANLDYREAINLDLRRDAAEISKVAIAAAPVLIIVDSLATVNRSDEDSSREMTPALQVLQSIARETSAGVLVLHHDKKDRTTLRGSSAIEAVVEIRLHLTKHIDRGGAKCLSNEKCRLAAETPERWLEIGSTASGIHVAQTTKPPTGEEADEWDLIMDLLKDGKPRTNREIANDIGKATPQGGCPGNLSRLLKKKRDDGYLVGNAAGGVTLALHPRDPTIPPYSGGSQDQSQAVA